MSDTSTANDRPGGDADSPRQISARGWREVVFQVKDDITRDTLSVIAAGVAFYAFLSIFPAITALISIYGLIADPSQLSQQVGSFSGTVPPSALQLVQKQLTSVAKGSGSALGLGLAISVLIALYSASKGVGTFMTALNVVYDEQEKRGFIKLKAVTLALTLVAIVLIIVLLFVIGLPAYLASLGVPAWLAVIIRVARWLIVLGLMIAVVAAVYAYAPSRERPRVQWVTPGAVLAIIVWLVASIAFSFYIAHFGSYSQTYGSAAAIVILMTWFWLSAFLILIGAEINAALENQARGKPRTNRGRR